MSPPNDASDLSPEFYRAWVKAFYELGIHPMFPVRACMFESACWAQAHNPNGNAVGLIQFMPSTLQGLGWASGWQEFLKLDATAQVPFVKAYFAPHASNINSAALCYVTVFTPANTASAARNGAGYILTSNTEHGGKFASAYDNNKVFDTAKKGYITVQDLSDAIARTTKGNRWENIKRNMKAAISEAGGDPDAGDIDPAPGTPAIQAVLASKLGQPAKLDTALKAAFITGCIAIAGYGIFEYGPTLLTNVRKKAET